MSAGYVYRRLKRDELQKAIDLVWRTFKAFRVADMTEDA